VTRSRSQFASHCSSTSRAATREHCFDGVFGVGLLVVPGAVVEVDEQHETGPCCSLVAIGQRVIPGDPTREHCGLVVQIGVEVGVAEAGLPCCSAESASSTRLAP
jgi:hypothetical protein